MKRLGIIDIGSNTMRLVIVEINDNGNFRIINELKKSARLSEGIDASGNFTSEKIKEAYFALKSFKNMCNSLGVEEILAVGTAAIRTANNNVEILAQAKSMLDIDIRIIDGIQEAKYAYRGVVQGIDVAEGLMIDIGGGSIELVYIKNNVAEKMTSLPFGTFEIKNILSHQSGNVLARADKLISYLRSKFDQVEWLAALSHVPIIGVGGIIRSIAKVDKTYKGYPIKLLHNYEMEIGDVDRIYNDTIDKTIDELGEVAGLAKNRADIFHGAMIFVKELMDYIQTKFLLVCRGGIREGVLNEYLDKHYDRNSDLFEGSLNNLFERYHIDKKHVLYVYNIVSKLYKEIDGKTSDDYNVDKVIRIASLLHDAGIDINFYDHNIHSFYVILYSGIYGVSHKELLMSGLCALLHFKHEVKFDEFQSYLALLEEEDIQVVKRIGLILRMAESFDSSMNQSLTDITCESSDTGVVLKIKAEDKPVIVLENIRGIEKKFKKVFKKPLIVEYEKS